MKIITIALSFLFSISLFAQEQERYSLVDIDIFEKNIFLLAQLGIEIDHGHIHPGKKISNIYSSRELKLIKHLGFEYKVLIDDVHAYYDKYGTMDPNADQLENRSIRCEEISDRFGSIQTPENYSYGTMGGYLTYDQAIAELDKMTSLYPNLITTRTPISDIKTHDDNEIYYLKISDNPLEEEDEPEILYNSLHHAREANSLSQLIFYMWYLLENYETDEEVKFLVDNTAMFFVPIVNPDGYIYNEQIRPQGGGLWRKNRFVATNGDTVGVDLNRNYGFEYAHDDFGSSTDPENATYRGIGPFSEPETEAMRRLCNAHNFQIALNYHTFGNLLIHPWGYNDQPTAEDALFKSLGNSMVEDNNYLIGTGTQTVGYVVNGDSDDWMYGEEMEKSKIYSLTPEVGPTFWPSESEIDFLNKTTVRQNLNAAHLLLSYGRATEIFPQSLLTETAGSFFFEIEKSGLKDDLLNFEVRSLTTGVELTNAVFNNIDLKTPEKMDLEVSYAIDTDILMGSVIELELRLDVGGFTRTSLITKSYSKPLNITIEYDNDLSSLEGFNFNQGWGLYTNDFVSAPSCITDSPSGRYENNVDSEIILLEPIDLSAAESANFVFSARWDIENDFDYVQVQATTDGLNYQAVCGEYTNPAVADQNIQGEVFDGVQFSWVEESICLDDFLGEEFVLVKFVFHSDGGLRRDGFYFDDIRIETGKGGVSTEILAQDFIRLSPNPANDFLIVRAEKARYDLGLYCILYDFGGKQIGRYNLDRPVYRIPIAQLQQGTYLVSVFDQNGFISNSKFVKQ